MDILASAHTLDEKIAEAHALVDEGVRRHITSTGKHSVAAICALFSGGNDSTVLTHLMRERATCAVHINTTIGIEQTRQYVRDTCLLWGLPLIEEYPPIDYEALVIDQGFPGPGHHWKMYQRLKERALRQVRRRFVERGSRKRIVFLAGRRRAESSRRMLVPDMERQASVVWISPLVNWTTHDMTAYRLRYPEIPQNQVSSLIHMSGECLCGAFATEGERKEIAFWFPEVDARLTELEAKVKAAGHPERLCKWGWGADSPVHRLSRSGPLCSSCDARQVPLFKKDGDVLA